MSAKIVMVMIWRTLSRLIYLLLAAAALAYAVGILSATVAFYKSTQKLTADDIKALEELTTKLERVWQDDGTLSATQGQIVQKNDELKAAVGKLKQANAQAEVASNLDTISANLGFLSEVIKNERMAGAGVVASLKAKVSELKDKVGRPDDTDKVAGTFLREGGKILVAVIWPLLVVLILLYLLRSRSAPEAMKKFLKPFKSVKLFEAELVLSDEAKTMAEGTFEHYRKQAVERYDLFVDRKRLREKFRDVADEIVKIVQQRTDRKLEKYRCTLHVPDIVFADTLYQLLDYEPAGVGRGRIFSIRFGLIGRVWRSRTSGIQKFSLISGGTDGKLVVDQSELVRVWGMTKYEAKTAAEGIPSFLCVMLADAQNTPVGLFYMDSKDPAAFNVTVAVDPNLTGQAKDRKIEEETTKNTELMLKDIADKCGERTITEILVKMGEELGGRAPLIRIYEK